MTAQASLDEHPQVLGLARGARRRPIACWAVSVRQPTLLSRQWLDGRDKGLYLQTGETLQSPLNADLLAQLLTFLGQLNAPGRTNQKLWLQGSTTLQGGQLDYLLVSKSIASSVTAQADWEVAWKPHAFTFNCAHSVVPVQQLQRFPPFGRTFQLPAFWEDDPFTSSNNRSLVWAPTKPDRPLKLRST